MKPATAYPGLLVKVKGRVEGGAVVVTTGATVKVVGATVVAGSLWSAERTTAAAVVGAASLPDITSQATTADTEHNTSSDRISSKALIHTKQALSAQVPHRSLTSWKLISCALTGRGKHVYVGTGKSVTYGGALAHLFAAEKSGTAAWAMSTANIKDQIQSRAHSCRWGPLQTAESNDHASLSVTFSLLQDFDLLGDLYLAIKIPQHVQLNEILSGVKFWADDSLIDEWGMGDFAGVARAVTTLHGVEITRKGATMFIPLVFGGLQPGQLLPLLASLHSRISITLHYKGIRPECQLFATQYMLTASARTWVARTPHAMQTLHTSTQVETIAAGETQLHLNFKFPAQPPVLELLNSFLEYLLFLPSAAILQAWLLIPHS